MGSPLGLQNTVTVGIISGLDRSITSRMNTVIKKPNRDGKSLNIVGSTSDSNSDLEITLDGFEKKDKIGNDTPEGYNFLIVKITVSNNLKDTLITKLKNFKLIDTYGREYEYSFDGQLAWYKEINESGVGDFFTISLYSGLRTELNIVYDLPEEVKELSLITTVDLPFYKLKLIVD